MKAEVKVEELARELLIGFATQYYTLWNYDSEKTYGTDAYGNRYVTSITHKYYYRKNISMDLEKVKKLYPDVEIEDDLRGQSRDFCRTEKVERPTGYFWFGKHYGEKIDNVIKEDFNYCLWAVERCDYDIQEQIQKHPVYLEYLKNEELKKQELLKNGQIVKEGETVELQFLTNAGFTGDIDYCITTAQLGKTTIYVRCSAKPIDGLYPYFIPIINGKPTRTKGKSLKVTVCSVIKTQVDNGKIEQSITIK